jgi:hypothetical protein
MPTQREASPDEPLGVLGRTRVEVDSRIKESEATGPVLKAGPMAAFTEAIAVTARAEIVCLVEGILDKVNRLVFDFELSLKLNLLVRSKELFYTPSILPSFPFQGPFQGWSSPPLSGGIHRPSCNIHRKFQVISTSKNSSLEHKSGELPYIQASSDKWTILRTLRSSLKHPANLPTPASVADSDTNSVVICRD